MGLRGGAWLSLVDRLLWEQAPGRVQVADYPVFLPLPSAPVCRDCDFSTASIAARTSSTSDRV